MRNAELGRMPRPWIIRASFLVLAALLVFSSWHDGRTVLAESRAAIFQADTLNLQQNTPNPFPITTEIRYGVAEAGEVAIRVYNTLGQEVQVLIDEDKQPGVEYQVQFPLAGSSFPSGQYTYVMTFTSAADGSKTKLIKRMQL